MKGQTLFLIPSSDTLGAFREGNVFVASDREGIVVLMFCDQILSAVGGWVG